VSSSSFGSRYNTVVNAMASATATWQATANVKFVHSTASDSSCSRTTGVVFNVRQVSGQSYLARSFFPSSSRSSREVLIDSSSFGSISPYTLAGILRHELGHTLGFRHEHTRPEAGTCFEDNSWRALTAYDAASVMHYPQCNGTQTGDLVLGVVNRRLDLDEAGCGRAATADEARSEDVSVGRDCRDALVEVDQSNGSSRVVNKGDTIQQLLDSRSHSVRAGDHVSGPDGAPAELRPCVDLDTEGGGAHQQTCPAGVLLAQRRHGSLRLRNGAHCHRVRCPPEGGRHADLVS